MPIARVFYNPLNGTDRDTYTIAAGSQIIDFLQEHYPAGFDSYIRVFAGVEEVAIDDMDRVVSEDEQVTVLVMPAGGVDVAAILITALVSAAVGFVINLLFPPPSLPGFGKSDESPVYSLNPTRNESRLGSPIECHYGTVSYPPSFAAAPYIFYSEATNDQFVDELLCLGHGNFTIEDIYIGDTPVTSIEPGSVQYWVFSQAEHNNQMGLLGSIISTELLGTSQPHPFRENVFTSPEVENWEFTDRSEAVTTPVPFAGRAFATVGNRLGHIDEVDANLNIRRGDVLTLAGSTSNNGDFLIGSVVRDPANSAIVSLFEDPDSANTFSDEDPLNAATVYTLNVDPASQNLTAGPFRAQKEGQQINVIECDIIFPQGLYRVDGNEGDIKSNTVEVKFTYQEIDADGLAVGLPIEQTRTYTNDTQGAYRATQSSGIIPNGFYEVSVSRETPIGKDERKHDITTWAGLKGKVVNSPDPVYSDTTLLAIRMKATNGLGAAARSRIRVTARRDLAVGDSANPVTAIKDIWTNANYGLGRPDTELDLVELDALETEWSAVDGPRFNGSFDQKGTGFEGMQAIASMTGSKVVQDGGLTTVIPDRRQSVRTALYTSGNIVKDSMEIEYSFDTTGDFDSVQVEYRNPDTFQVQYVTYPPSGTQPDTYELFGCTDAVYAEQYARYLNNVKKIRRKQIKFNTELEALIPRFGDRIAVAHPMPAWGQSGVIVEVIDDMTFRVDHALDWQNGPHVMLLRSPTGTPSSQYTVTQGANPSIVVFPEAPDVEVNGPDDREPTSYTFGVDKRITSDFILSKITPLGDTLVEIMGQTYTANIYTGAPPHMSY